MAEEVVRLLNVPAVVNQFLDGHLEPRETVSDMLTEILHFAGEQGVDFSDALEIARDNYEEERLLER
jgi:hypothetical protein